MLSRSRAIALPPYVWGGVATLCVVALELWPGAAIATDWFWRPNAGGPYGISDGRTYASAWNASTLINWARIVPGDTLYVCGRHDGGYPDNALAVGSSGQVDKPVRISGDCPNDPGSILASGAKWTDGWSVPDLNGVLQREYGGTAGQMLDEDGLLFQLAVPPDALSPCRSFAQIGQMVFYKPCGRPRTLFPQGQAPVIEVRGKDYIQIDHLDVSNADILISVYNSRGFSLTRSKLRFGTSYSLIVTGSTTGGTVTDNVISDVGNGPYFVTDPTRHAESHDDWLVARNKIHDVYGTTDSHCIGWQAGSNNVVRANTLVNCEGSGITIYDPAFGAQLKNNRVEENDIQVVRSLGRGGSNQRGIEIGSTNCPNHPDDDRGNVIRNNRIRDVEGAAIYLKAGRPTAPGVFSWQVIGNTVDGAADGVYWVDTNWYGEAPTNGSGDRDPCALTNRIPSLSAPGFLLQDNHFRNIRNAFVMPQPLDPSLQSTDMSGIVAHSNVYEGVGAFIWQGNRRECPTRFRQSLNLCRLPALEGYRMVSGTEQGSMQVASRAATDSAQ